ncbi:MAG: YcaO-like family protein [Bacteriovoracaceae bacterium]|nr:YcaO-like family protein [Bacteriovoracaceae bacterium]
MGLTKKEENDILYGFLKTKQKDGVIKDLTVFEDEHSHPLKSLFNRYMIEYTMTDSGESVLSIGGTFDKSLSLTIALAEAVERLLFLRYCKSLRVSFSFKSLKFKKIDVAYKNTNGFAIHNSLIKCIQSSLCEMVERHEMLKMWFSKSLPLFEIDFSKLSYIKSLQLEVESQKGVLRLFYVSSFQGFHIILFTLLNKDSDDYLLLSSFASDQDLFIAIKRGFFELSRSYLSSPKKQKSKVTGSPLEIIDHTLFYQKEENLHYFDFILNGQYNIKNVDELGEKVSLIKKYYGLYKTLRSLEAQIVFFPTKEIGLKGITCLKIQSPKLLEVYFGKEGEKLIEKSFKDITGKEFNHEQGPHPLA